MGMNNLDTYLSRHDRLEAYMSDAPVLEPVHVVDDFAAASDFEKKHTPFISLSPRGDEVLVSVNVGEEVPHPNGPDHYITWIELHANGTPIARFDLSPVATHPHVTIALAVEPGTVIRALEHCNLHGVWAMEATV
jgi:superoxide reductase